MARKGWSTVEVPNGWFIIRYPRPSSVRWPHNQNRTGQTATSASDWEFQSEGSNTPDSTVSSHSSTRKEDTRTSQIRCTHASEQGNFADGELEEKRALELALHKAQKQAEEHPLAQTQVTKYFVDRVIERMRTRRFGWLRWHCKPWTRKITTSANSHRPKYGWKSSRRRL